MKFRELSRGSVPFARPHVGEARRCSVVPAPTPAIRSGVALCVMRRICYGRGVRAVHAGAVVFAVCSVATVCAVRAVAMMFAVCPVAGMCAVAVG